MPERDDISATTPQQIQEAPALTQGERLLYTFIAPSKTFTDILRSASWWLPFLVMAVVVYGYLFAIQRQVGWDTVATNISRHEGRAPEQMPNASSQRTDRIHTITIAIVKGTLWGYPVIILIVNAVAALVLLGTINLLFNGKANFACVFAVCTYSLLPRVFSALISSVALFLGMGRETFYLNNPLGTNVGYYLSSDSPSWLVALGNSLDILTIWCLVLIAIGLAIVAKVNKAFGFITVFGWALILLSARVAISGLRI